MKMIGASVFKSSFCFKKYSYGRDGKIIVSIAGGSSNIQDTNVANQRSASVMGNIHRRRILGRDRFTDHSRWSLGATKCHQRCQWLPLVHDHVRLNRNIVFTWFLKRNCIGFKFSDSMKKSSVEISPSESFLSGGRHLSLTVQSAGDALHVFTNGHLSGKFWILYSLS